MDRISIRSIGAKNGDTIALRVVGKVMLHHVVLIAVVDVENAPIHTGRIGKVAFVVSHAAVSASPFPNRIRRANRLGLLHAGEPRDVMFDHAV